MHLYCCSKGSFGFRRALVFVTAAAHGRRSAFGDRGRLAPRGRSRISRMGLLASLQQAELETALSDGFWVGGRHCDERQEAAARAAVEPARRAPRLLFGASALILVGSFNRITLTYVPRVFGAPNFPTALCSHPTTTHTPFSLDLARVPAAAFSHAARPDRPSLHVCLPRAQGILCRWIDPLSRSCGWVCEGRVLRAYCVVQCVSVFLP